MCLLCVAGPAELARERRRWRRVSGAADLRGRRGRPGVHVGGRRLLAAVPGRCSRPLKLTLVFTREIAASEAL